MKDPYKESIFERGMHMIDKAIHTLNKLALYIIKHITVTIKIAFIDFSFGPLNITLYSC